LKRAARAAGIGDVAPGADDGVPAECAAELNGAAIHRGVQHGVHRIAPDRPAEGVRRGEGETEAAEVDLEYAAVNGA
jgi:hypothetical protein